MNVRDDLEEIISCVRCKIKNMHIRCHYAIYQRQEPPATRMQREHQRVQRWTEDEERACLLAI